MIQPQTFSWKRRAAAWANGWSVSSDNVHGHISRPLDNKYSAPRNEKQPRSSETDGDGGGGGGVGSLWDRRRSSASWSVCYAARKLWAMISVSKGDRNPAATRHAHFPAYGHYYYVPWPCRELKLLQEASCCPAAVFTMHTDARLMYSAYTTGLADSWSTGVSHETIR